MRDPTPESNNGDQTTQMQKRTSHSKSRTNEEEEESSHIISSSCIDPSTWAFSFDEYLINEPDLSWQVSEEYVLMNLDLPYLNDMLNTSFADFSEGVQGWV